MSSASAAPAAPRLTAFLAGLLCVLCVSIVVQSRQLRQLERALEDALHEKHTRDRLAIFELVLFNRALMRSAADPEDMEEDANGQGSATETNQSAGGSTNGEPARSDAGLSPAASQRAGEKSPASERIAPEAQAGLPGNGAPSTAAPGAARGSEARASEPSSAQKGGPPVILSQEQVTKALATRSLLAFRGAPSSWQRRLRGSDGKGE
jgi:hypothetical protein